MLGSSLLFFLLGHQLTLDMSLTLFMTLTFIGFCNAQGVGRWRGWMLLSWAGMGRRVHDQGADRGVLPIFALSVYSVLRRDFAPWRRLLLVRGALLFAVLGAPWLLLIQHRLPQFLQFFFVREPLPTLSDEDRGPLPALVVLHSGADGGILPWLLPALRCVCTDWRAGSAQPGFDIRRFAWVWCAVVFGFFSASDSKLIPYILPLFPALVLLMATRRCHA